MRSVLLLSVLIFSDILAPYTGAKLTDETAFFYLVFLITFLVMDLIQLAKK